MALLKTLSLLLLSLLTLLGLGLVQPSYGETMHQRFLWEHVDSSWTGGNNWYCNTMMQRRGVTRPKCKQFHTFIHTDIGTIKNICNAPNIRCENGRMNCHGRHMRVTDCSLTASSRGNCRYEGKGRSRRVVIACQGNPPVPVRFDR